jgi:hypothetical protein
MLAVVVAVFLLLAAVLVARPLTVPVKALVAAFMLMSLIGAFFFKPSPNLIAGVDRVPVAAFLETRPLTILLYLAAPAFAIMIGARLAYRPGLVAKGDTRALIRGLLPPRAFDLIPPVAAVMVGVFVVGVGPATLLHSDAYLARSGPPVLVKAGTVLLPVALVLLGRFVVCRVGIVFL